MGTTVTLTECNGGDRHSASGVAVVPEVSFRELRDYVEIFREASEFERVEPSLQPLGDKTPAPSPVERGLRAGGEGGRGEYLDTSLATSRHGEPEAWTGSTLESVEFNRNRIRNKTLLQLYHSLWDTGRDLEAKKLIGCGRWFRPSKPLPCGTRFLLPYHCNSVFCPECASRRSKPLQKLVFERVKPKKYRYFFLTLTVRNIPSLTREALDGIVRSFAKLRRTALWKEEVRGGVYSIETTFNRATGEWHPHLHVLLECKRRLPAPWLGNLKAEWKRFTGSWVIRLDAMFGVSSKGKKQRRINRAALKELVKYATKAASFAQEPARVAEFLDAFKNVRRMQSFGSFKGVVAQAKEESDATPKNWEPCGCKCGLCTWGMVEWEREPVHISQTVLFPDGSRQLRLFDSGSDPPREGAFVSDECNRIAREFAALRAAHESSLFAPQLRLV